MFRTGSLNFLFMTKAQAKSGNVSAKPLFDWFKSAKENRGRLRATGYSDGRITNWRARGIPRAEVGPVAGLMGISYEDYLVAAGESPPKAREPGTAYRALSDEALQIALAFDQLQSQAREFIREQVFIYTVIDKSFPWLRHGKPIGKSYAEFERWHQENITAKTMLDHQRTKESSK